MIQVHVTCHCQDDPFLEIVVFFDNELATMDDCAAPAIKTLPTAPVLCDLIMKQCLSQLSFVSFLLVQCRNTWQLLKNW